jgi:hypothetical protein
LPAGDGSHSTDQPNGTEVAHAGLSVGFSKVIPENRLARLSILILSKTHPISLVSSGTNSTSEVALVGLANETITTRQRQLAIKLTHHTQRVDTTKATCSECNFPRNG